MSGPAAPGPLAQKKRLTASERDPVARASWWDAATWLNPVDLIFLDETSTNRAMTPLRARAPRGERAPGTAPRNHGRNVTLVAVLTPTGMAAPLVVEGAVDGLAFETYVRQVLVPTLRPGQVVILDNLSVHKRAAARTLIEAADCHLVFLPAYSPDFNPIELAFAKLKQALRRAAARTHDALVEAIGAALTAITEHDARAFFAHCGFPIRDHSFRNPV